MPKVVVDHQAIDSAAIGRLSGDRVGVRGGMEALPSGQSEPVPVDGVGCQGGVGAMPKGDRCFGRAVLRLPWQEMGDHPPSAVVWRRTRALPPFPIASLNAAPTRVASPLSEPHSAYGAKKAATGPW
jgi:hypothetical protein